MTKTTIRDQIDLYKFHRGWKIPVIPNHIGNERIYDEQKLAGLQMFINMDDNRLSRLDANTQSGKTNATIVAYWLFDQFYKDRYGVKPKKYYLLNIPDNQTKKQNQERFDNAGLTDVIVEHASAYKKLTIDYSHSAIIIFDEWHFGLNTGGEFDKFLNKIDISNITGHPNNLDHWGKRSEHMKIALVSATPFDALLVTDGWPPRVWLEPGENYYGIVDMNNQGRFMSAKDDTHFIKEIDEALIAGASGLIVKRSCGNSLTKLTKELKNRNVSYDVFSSTTEKKIDDIKRYMHNYVDDGKIKVIFIKNGLRAGVTLIDEKFHNTLNNVIMWYDSPDANAVTVVQSIGRLTGNMKGKYGTFPIYCNIEEIKDIVNYITSKGQLLKDSPVPSSTNTVRKGPKEKFLMEVYDTKEEAKKKLKEYHPTHCNDTVRTVSGTNHMDLAYCITQDIRGEEYMEDKATGGLHRSNAIHVDSPNPKYQTSFEGEISEIINKYLVYKPVEISKKTEFKREICISKD